jgi:hypothetical protein
MVAERTQGTNPVAALLFDADKIAYWSQVMGQVVLSQRIDSAATIPAVYLDQPDAQGIH